MRYLLFIFILTVLLVTKRDAKGLKAEGIQSTHELWENNLVWIRISPENNCFELPDNNDLDSPVAVWADLYPICDQQPGTGIHVTTHIPEVFLETVPFSLIDLPPPSVF